MNHFWKILLISFVQCNGLLTALCCCKPSQKQLRTSLNEQIRARRDPATVRQFITRNKISLDYNMLALDRNLTAVEQELDPISPLEYAIHDGLPALAQVLLECKANPSYSQSGTTPLEQAHRAGNQSIERMIGARLETLGKKIKKPKTAFDGYQLFETIELDSMAGE
jgi:ankyrin repeat protein